MLQNSAYAFEVSIDEVNLRSTAPKLLGGNQ